MPANYPIHLVILDERPIVRAGIAACLREAPDLQLLGSYGTLPECVATGVEMRPRVVIVGQLRRYSLSVAIRELRQEQPELRVIVLSPCGGSTRARLAISAGADGFMQMRAGAAELVVAVRAVAQGDRFLDNATATDMANRIEGEDLTTREIDVLRRVAAGLPNKQIAGELATTEGTVKSTMKRILHKLDAADRTHAVVIAARRGFITVSQ